jgi:hypothetical protein
MLNDLLKSRLELIANDELMIKALRAVVDDRIAKVSPDIDKTNDNKILGEKYRAVKEAEKLIDGVLEDISSYKTQRSSNNQVNKGK